MKSLDYWKRHTRIYESNIEGIPIPIDGITEGFEILQRYSMRSNIDHRKLQFNSGN